MSELGQKLISIVREKAAENPDFVYQQPNGDTCVYVHNGQPSCIIGHALWEAGLIDQEIEWNTSLNGEKFGVLANSLALKIAAAEREWLELVQSKQDNEETWRDSVSLPDDRWVAHV